MDKKKERATTGRAVAPKTGKVRFTAGRVAAFTCPDGKAVAYLWDSETPGLGLLARPNGKATFIFQGSDKGRAIRAVIGLPKDWPIPKAQARAREMQRDIDEGRDPRQVKAEKSAADTATRDANRAQGATVGEVWARYIEERRPYWRPLTYRDHAKIIAQGGQPRANRRGVKTVPGALAALAGMRLAALDSDVIQAWAAKEAKTRPSQTRLALRMLKAFLRWASLERDLKGKVDPTAADGKKLREVAGKPGVRKDYLQREQLATWFEHVRQIPNPVISAYLQCLLLTGARREEMARLKWEDVNFRWRGMDIADKVEDSRAIPVTDYVAHLLQNLPRRNEWVFSSALSKPGHLVETGLAHRRACAAAGLVLTLHGLRRSFKSLSEWLEVPVGVVAQIMGHKPSATAEKHYTVRPLDLLRVHHQRIETWILEQAGVTFDPDAIGLRVVAS